MLLPKKIIEFKSQQPWTAVSALLGLISMAQLAISKFTLSLVSGERWKRHEQTAEFSVFRGGSRFPGFAASVVF